MSLHRATTYNKNTETNTSFFPELRLLKELSVCLSNCCLAAFFLIKLCTTHVVLTHTSTVSQMVSVPVHLPLKRHDANGAFFDGSKSSTFWRAGNRKLASFLHYHWTSNGNQHVQPRNIYDCQKKCSHKECEEYTLWIQGWSGSRRVLNLEQLH